MLQDVAAILKLLGSTLSTCHDACHRTRSQGNTGRSHTISNVRASLDSRVDQTESQDSWVEKGESQDSWVEPGESQESREENRDSEGSWVEPNGSQNIGLPYKGSQDSRVEPRGYQEKVDIMLGPIRSQVVENSGYVGNMSG